MRIAVSVDDSNGLDSVCSPHFGRCPYFAVAEVEGRDIRSLEFAANPFYPNHQPGQVPGFVHSLGADVMLTGGMGGRAIMFFQQYGIEPVTGAAGTVRHALEAYLGGALRGAESCTESAAHGHDVDSQEVEQDEIGRLREEVEMLNQQLDKAIKRLDDGTDQ
ncbi:MAG: dinitrogenase iron-molybdenum cofactor biosynthesis protein [Chloroflexi bacterium]|nr:dinitrogenase iron-molybdenum cofactor biosynthesis protein [Chloroflexota bacterium]